MKKDQSNINLPNLLSIIRILMIPLALWGMVKEEYFFSFSILIIAGITDALDGFLARRLGQFTLVGRILDPLADKILFVTLFASMGFGLHLFPFWFTWVVLLRDVFILAGFFFLVRFKKVNVKEMKPTFLGKLHTGLLFLFLCLFLLSLSYGVAIPIDVLIYIIAGSSILSFASYFLTWIKKV
ncbi:CDP-alcohol phosphatidyltransferase family protein [Alphaproteobacteria bacterium]|nr:CDP-alcohol phosphatidyltransferase family protein [Alphaproteobacteria bacterium]